MNGGDYPIDNVSLAWHNLAPDLGSFLVSHGTLLSKEVLKHQRPVAPDKERSKQVLENPSHVEVRFGDTWNQGWTRGAGLLERTDWSVNQ